MRLRRVHLMNFRRFADFEAQFSPGINVVKGPRNEMGKSTLLEGIIVALFHNPKSAAREVKAYASWGSTGQFRTTLEFEHDGNGYLLEKDFDRGTVRLTGIDSGEETHTFKEVAERMDGLLGTKSTGYSCAPAAFASHKWPRSRTGRRKSARASKRWSPGAGRASWHRR